ncbi:MAG: glutamate--tRNA ligase [Nannocystaceae bacterium]
MTVRTRIAPSPTGDPHVGTAYIALFNQCFARQHDGKFVLRIEDTDRARSTATSEKAIIDSLRWLGLDWDEGPDKGGEHGPYRQSERMAIYDTHAKKLLDGGHAFRCFCTAERLGEVRKKQEREKASSKGYDGHCLGFSQAEVEGRVAAGESYVLRLGVPREGTCTVVDLLRDPIVIGWETVDMQVLVKADGMPTYHLANVVDDHLMEITHVLRGEEWITSAPKHLLLYQYFGWEPPVLCHLPLLRNPDGSKLSKRKNPTSIRYYERMGFLPEALLNYLGRMGWSMPDGKEKFSLAEMTEEFDVERVSLGGPVFDVEKLSWLNGKWIRENLSTEQFAERMVTWAVNREYLMPILPLVQERANTLAEVFPLIIHFLSGNPRLTEESFLHKKLNPELAKKILVFSSWRLDALSVWDAPHIEEALASLSAEMDVRLGTMNMPLFVAVSGKQVSTPLYETLAILGADVARARLRHAWAALGGLGKKQARKLEKEYDALRGARASS